MRVWLTAPKARRGFDVATTVTVGGTPLANEGQVSSVVGATTVNFNALSNGGPQNFTSGIASYTTDDGAALWRTDASILAWLEAL